MQYVNLGTTGLRVSRVCLGMMSFGANADRPWALAEAEAEPIIRRAVEGGITFFDTADVYNGGESEVVTGRVLSKLLSREELVVATKVHGRTMPGENGRGLSRKHIMASIDALAAPARAGLRRPLPDPPLGSADADRGDDGRARTTSSRPARPATSARAACSPGSSQRRRPRPSAEAGHGSSRCRTTTTSSTARRSGR